MGGVGQAVGGVISGITGQSGVANAQGAAANAQLGQQQQNYSNALPTDAEMQQLQQAMSVNQQGINQSQQLLQSANPALLAAGQQALQLMQGKSAAALAPIQNQRSQGRAQLEQQLQQQLGPGYKTSSAGIQALNNYDQATTNAMTNAQQSTLGQFLGVSQNAEQLGMYGQNQGINNMSNLTGQQQNMNLKALQYAPNPALAYQGQIANAQANAGGMSLLLGGGMMAASSQLNQSLGGGSSSGTAPMSASNGYTSSLGGQYDLGSAVGTPNIGSALQRYKGGIIPGKANMPGNHPANDTMLTLLSPGEGVIDKESMSSRKKAHAKVDQMFDGGVKGKVRKGKNKYWDGSAGDAGSTPTMQTPQPESSFWDNAKATLSNAFSTTASADNEAIGKGVKRGMDPSKAKAFSKGFNGE